MNGKKNTFQKLLATTKVELKTKPIVVNTYIKKDLKSITQTSTIRNYKEMKLNSKWIKVIKVKAKIIILKRKHKKSF